MELSSEIVTVTTREPFVSGAKTVTSVRQLLVRLRWEGLTGLGTALLGRGSEDVLRPCAAALAGASPFQLEQVMERCEAALPGQAWALAALDMALHDLLGKAAGLPLYRMWGLDGLPLPPTSIGVGMMPEGERIERARSLSSWPILKFKLGSPEVGELFPRLRDAYPGRIWVDANCTLDADAAIALAERLHKSGVELLEQPIPAGSPDRLRYIRERSPIPLVADEDCATAEDLLRLQGCVSVVNIKLVKCGGLRRALEMIRLARRLGLEVMLGCKLESALGITAMAHLAGLAKYLDLDGHLHLAEDPFSGLTVEAGQLSLPRLNGLGVTTKSVEGTA